MSVLSKETVMFLFGTLDIFSVKFFLIDVEI